MNFSKGYFIGLDIGTDSVGYAVTDERYKLLKFKGEPMWGSHLFDPASQCAERRAFRTARRRLDRRQQRAQLADEIFCNEVVKTDPDFYIRKKESALYAEDKTKPYEYLFFNDDNYNDRDFHKEYPTIHHLLCALIDDKDKKFDIRLINIAVDWLLAHRGHFLSEVGTDNIDKIKDFSAVYERFMDYFDEEDDFRSKPWDAVDCCAFGEILKHRGINYRKNALKQLLYDGRIPEGDYFLDRKELVNLLAGSKVQVNKLFCNAEYEDDFKFAISDDMEIILPQLAEDDAELITCMAAMYDWSVLSDILGEHKYISKAKVTLYEQHKKDLAGLKRFVRNNAKEKYNEIFRKESKDLCNYVAYVYNADSDKKDIPKRKASRDEFYTYLRKAIDIDTEACSEEDRLFYEDMKERMVTGQFMPKQVTPDNRVIPYQLYYYEYKAILDNAIKHYSFLEDTDNDGYSNIDKLKSIFLFKIPYYVGPLRNDGDKDKYAWVVKKGNGKIYPWNFDKNVDLDRSEDEFIRRMTNSCTYLPGEDVLPKWSLLYTKYMVLNEINNLKVNGVGISADVKQMLYMGLFEKRLKVTPKAIRDYLVSNGIIQKDDQLNGIDETIKSSLKSRIEFRNLLDKKILTTDDVESIISRRTYAEDNMRYKQWLKKEYSVLSEDDIKYVSRLKYKDFGRLSERFLNGIEGMCKETGEVGTIMHFLWCTNDNLMKLLSDKYTFKEVVGEIRSEYYAEHKLSVGEQMEELGISNAVKRPVTRTLSVVEDVVSTVGHAPRKIFVEMARGADDVKKRSVSRKDQIIELYKSVEADTSELERQLEEMGDTANNRLQSDALFLYFIQLGKCMYSGTPLDITQLKSTVYNIDHIWPQSLVKDDSLLNNRVLVLSKINGDKKDVYPIDESIRHSMRPMWKMLCDHKLITKEKYERLIRNTPFTEDEKLGFINRQLVETRQSMKAVTQMLQNLYPDTEIVYVKAKLASDFRNGFKLAPKVRTVNDLHHAKDAFLNIVVGNVYNERFTKKWFNVNDKYSINTKVLFGRELVHGDTVIWSGEKDLESVKKTYSKNNIHLTKYAYCQKGGLFDQMPVKKGLGQMPLKAGMDIGKYGGYNKVAASFFAVVRYLKGGKPEVSFLPVDLAVSQRFLEDEEFAKEYAKDFLGELNKKKIEGVEFPLGKRIVKIKTVLSLDGYRVWVNGKANGGKIILLTGAESLKLNDKYMTYVKKIESYSEKKKDNRWFKHDEIFDGLSEDSNLLLYDELLDKLNTELFRKMPGNQTEIMKDGRDIFISLDFEKQITVLCNCLNFLKSGRTGGCDLTLIGGKNASGVMTLGANLSSCKNYSNIRLIDMSPSGIHENTSVNLLELL